MVSSGGAELGATIAGVEVVASGGTAIGDQIGSGGSELIQSGGAAQFAGISGGTLKVAGGGSVNEVRFQGGSLVLDASASFNGLVAGFGTSDQIDASPS